MMQEAQRFWEVDSLRGLAIVLMVFYHFAYDIWYFTGQEILSGDLFWFLFPRAAATIFMLLVGVSLSLSNIRQPSRGFRHYLLRGMEIFLGGMMITVVTWYFVPSAYILFGALHFIGASIVLGYFFLGRGRKNTVVAFILLAVGIYLSGQEFQSPYLLWLGFAPQGFRTLDYFPLLPWFGLVLLGIHIGESLYQGYKRRMQLKDYSNNALFAGLSFMGRHSLLIYFLHQPTILAALYLSGVIQPGSLS